MLLALIITDRDKSAIEFIYDEHSKKMLYTAGKILGDNLAQEAVHDVFVKIIEKNEFEKLREKPGLYFVIMTRNHSLNLLRKEKKIQYTLAEEVMDESIFIAPISPEDTVLYRDAGDRLTELIRRLKPIYREILEYRFIADYSVKETAEALDITESAVTTRQNRALKILRELYESEENKWTTLNLETD